MNFFKKLFNNSKVQKQHQPEHDYKITITESYIRVEHPRRKTEEVKWENIKEIKLINTADGPWVPDVWLALLGDEDGCLIPQGSTGYDTVYDIVSKYKDFNFNNVINSMKCTDNAEFLLWTKK